MLWHNKMCFSTTIHSNKNCIWYNAIQSSQVCVCVCSGCIISLVRVRIGHRGLVVFSEKRRLLSTSPLWNSSPKSSLPVPGIESLRTEGQGWVQVRPSSLKLPQGFIARKQICESSWGQTCGRERALRPKGTRSRRRFPAMNFCCP